jgi:ABC-2 type transport system permease protein
MAMSDASMVIVQARYALISALRNPRALVFGLIFPPVLLVMFNAIFTAGSEKSIEFAGGTISSHAYFTAGLAAYAIGLATFTQLIVGITTQRETGQLKRLRGTPMPAWTFLAAQVLRAIAFVLLSVVTLFALGTIVFGVHLSGEGLAGVVVYVLLGTAAMATLGIAATALAPNADTAAAIGPFVIVMLSFISGVFVSVETLPNWLEQVGKLFPLYHLAAGLQSCLVQGGGTGLSRENVVPLVVWGAAGLIAALRRFRWEPQQR